jgi:2'-hydroxyisoflavone reductase
MNLLILGGTRFLGPHLLHSALQAQHHVTLFHRGKTPLPPSFSSEIEILQGDRNSDLSALRHRKWDALIDTCGYFPPQVRRSAQEIQVDRYFFISTVSVYVQKNHPLTESSPTETLATGQTENDTTMETYGIRKALCEQALDEILPQQTCHIRPGLIVGPLDPTHRFTYWVSRTLQGGSFLVPQSFNLFIQYIDVRDLADWMIRLVETRSTGIYNAIGPDPHKPLSFETYIETCRRLAKHPSEKIEVSSAFLEAEGIQAWTNLPLWLPQAQKSFYDTSNQKAIQDGLTFRSLEDTIKATQDWILQETKLPQPQGMGLTPEQEKNLLEKWKMQQKNSSL